MSKVLSLLFFGICALCFLCDGGDMKITKDKVSGEKKDDEKFAKLK